MSTGLRIQKWYSFIKKGSTGSPTLGIWGRNQGICLEGGELQVLMLYEQLLPKNTLEFYHLIERNFHKIMLRKKTYGKIKPPPQIHVASERVLIRLSPSCPNDNVFVHMLCAGSLSSPTSPHSRCAAWDHSTNKPLALPSLSRGWSLGEGKLRPRQGAPG